MEKFIKGFSDTSNPAGTAGVLGESTIFNGVLGYTSADGHAGVAGACDEGKGNGVYGRSKNANGVYGTSTSKDNNGVVGFNDGGGNGVLGHSKNGIGVFGLSDNHEGVQAVTKSTITAGLAAYQANPNSQSAAIFAKHEGGGAAGIFEGTVHISKKLLVSSVSILDTINDIKSKLATPNADIRHIETRLKEIETYIQRELLLKLTRIDNDIVAIQNWINQHPA